MMKQILLIFLANFLIINLLISQTERPIFNTKRIENAPKIDGNLDELIWADAPEVTDFTEFLPDPNSPSEQRTVVKVVYDDDAIYIGATMYDKEPDLILSELGVRDNMGVNADNFGVYIDGFNTRQGSFAFIVTAAGVQADAQFTLGDDDFGWDGVWRSATTLTEEGWVAEFQIPYSALRFPKQPQQTWAVNFIRTIRRNREQSSWSAIDVSQNNVIEQYGTLTGIENIVPPLRLSATPYFASYAVHNPGADPWNTSINGGMDVKFGINESFTLDVALIPDFGQVQSDNVQLNLGPFEQRFSENRPFFTEGTEMFGRANLLYSRRVGGTPIGYADLEDALGENEVLISNPERAQLLNAMKLSGRTKTGMGVGFFNAITANTKAQVETEQGGIREEVTNPLTNYNVVVVDKQLKNNSYFSLINTNVSRRGNFRDANVTGTEFRLANKKNSYAVEAGGSVSQIFRPDEDYELGHTYYIEAGKVSGNFRFEASRSVESATYDRNDLGFLYNNNSLEHSLSVSYQTFEPKGNINRKEFSLGASHQMLYNPNEFNRFITYFNSFVLLNSFFAAGVNGNFVPVNSYDYFEARTEGQPFKRPPAIEISAFVSSDYRKRFAYNARIGVNKYLGWERRAFWTSFGPRIRVNNKWSIFPNASLVFRFDDVGYNTKTEDEIIFGTRDRRDFEFTLNTTYLFNNKMSLGIRARHYWALVNYKEFHYLLPDGELGTTTYNTNNNRNFNVWNVDLVYRWIFSPGSELNIIWKNSSLMEGESLIYNYLENFTTMLNEDQQNLFSLKLIYYIDYSMLQNR